MAYAAHQFRLAAPQPGGGTLREHYEQAAENPLCPAHVLEELEGPPLSDAAAPVWGWFLEISARRPSGGFGAGAIGWDLLDAWQRVTGERLLMHERDWIFELDELFRAAQPEPPRPA